MSAWELSSADIQKLRFGPSEDRIAYAASFPADIYEGQIRVQLAEGLGIDPETLDPIVEEQRQFAGGFREMLDGKINGHADAPPFLPVDAYADEAPAQVNGKRVPGLAPADDERPRIAAPIWFKDAEPNLERRDIVDELLGSGALSAIYGGPGSGKTFLALDIAIAVARGGSWCGRSVLDGIVLYAAGEGYRSVLDRVAAYRIHHFAGERRALPFATIPEAINLLDPLAHVDAVDALAKRLEAEWNLPTVLVVIDTLARSIAGANENASEVMGAAMKNADRLRGLTGAHVCLIHHSGKDAGNGARGHSSLRAALDTEIEVTGAEGVRTAKVTKQRDLPTGAAFAFNLKPIVLGTNRKSGKEVTSCIVEHLDAPPQSSRREPSSKNQAAFLAGLRQFVGDDPETIVTPAEASQIATRQGLKQRARLIEVRKALREQGWIQETVGGFRLMGETL